VTRAREHGRPDAVAALDDEPWVEGEAAGLRLAQTRAQARLGVRRAVTLGELGCRSKYASTSWEGRNARMEPRRRDAQREADALRQDERPDGERAVLADEAHRLVATAHRQERALPVRTASARTMSRAMAVMS
jgi:hypothetical protein